MPRGEPRRRAFCDTPVTPGRKELIADSVAGPGRTVPRVQRGLARVETRGLSPPLSGAAVSSGPALLMPRYGAEDLARPAERVER
jgi:hypothetical protein